MIDYNKVAELLEAVASYVDDVEYQKTAKEREARGQKVEQLVSRYTDKTGETSDKFREKLSGLDDETLNEVLKLAVLVDGDGSLDSLGGPADTVDTSLQPLTVKEAAEQAEDRFLNWIMAE